MNLHGLTGEMYNVIHDNIQIHIKRHSIKINHCNRIFYVSLYKWYNLNRIAQMIENMICPLL